MQGLKAVLKQHLKRKGIDSHAVDRFVKDVWSICRNDPTGDLQSINAHLQLLGWPRHAANAAIIELVAAIYERHRTGQPSEGGLL